MANTLTPPPHAPPPFQDEAAALDLLRARKDAPLAVAHAVQVQPVRGTPEISLARAAVYVCPEVYEGSPVGVSGDGGGETSREVSAYELSGWWVGCVICLAPWCTRIRSTAVSEYYHSFECCAVCCLIPCVLRHKKTYKRTQGNSFIWTENGERGHPTHRIAPQSCIGTSSLTHCRL